MRPRWVVPITLSLIVFSTVGGSSGSARDASAEWLRFERGSDASPDAETLGLRISADGSISISIPPGSELRVDDVVHVTNTDAKPHWMFVRLEAPADATATVEVPIVPERGTMGTLSLALPEMTLTLGAGERIGVGLTVRVADAHVGGAVFVLTATGYDERT